MSDESAKFQESWEEHHKKQKARARRRLFQLVRRQQGLATIRVEYDGYGDSGQIEGIEYLRKNGKPLAGLNSNNLNALVQEYVLLVLPSGWENDTGAFGTIEIDVASRKAHVVHNGRFEDYETDEFEDG